MSNRNPLFPPGYRQPVMEMCDTRRALRRAKWRRRIGIALAWAMILAGIATMIWSAWR